MSKTRNIPFFIQLEWCLYYLAAKSLLVEYNASDSLVENRILDALNILNNELREGNSSNDYKQFISDFESFCSEIEAVHKHILIYNQENKFDNTDVLLINDIYNILLLLKKEILSNNNSIIDNTYFDDNLLSRYPYNLYNLGKYNYNIKVEKIIK